MAFKICTETIGGQDYDLYVERTGTFYALEAGDEDVWSHHVARADTKKGCVEAVRKYRRKRSVVLELPFYMATDTGYPGEKLIARGFHAGKRHSILVTHPDGKKDTLEGWSVDQRALRVLTADEEAELLALGAAKIAAEKAAKQAAKPYDQLLKRLQMTPHLTQQITDAIDKKAEEPASVTQIN
jgi:hypothetical protein